MSTKILLNELERNYDWYQRKGKLFKRGSYATRICCVFLFALSAIAMSAFGASVLSVSLGIAGVAAFLTDKVFGLTRNWLEFSYLEVKLASSIALIKYHNQREDFASVLHEFRTTMVEIEKETLGWQVDVREGLAEIKKLLPQKTPPSE